jgi:alanyl-tRNA synthetase
MPTTEKLFYSRPELIEAEARVLAVLGGPERPILELDRTIFYPEGGGQACDLGTLELALLPAAELASVTEEEGRILHALAGPFPAKAGDHLRLRLDAARRLGYSQAHTGQHLLSTTFMRLFGAATVSVHLSRDRSSIDFDMASLPDEDLGEAEDLVEQTIADDYPIRVHLCPPEDPASFPLRKRPPAGAQELRIVEIDGVDFTPCCGTHLSSTGKLRVLRVLGTERYKGMTRLYFVAGGRAAADYRSVSRIARESARILGTSVAELPEAIEREAEKRKALEFANTGLARERAAAEAREALTELGAEIGAGLAAGAKAPLVSRRYVDRDAASLMESAKAFAAVGLTALLASVPELTVQVLSPSSDARLGERLKPLLAAVGGKGGGGASSFRAVFPSAAALESFMDAVERELGSGPGLLVP